VAAAGDASPTVGPWGALVVVAIGALFLGFGLALLLNFRGFTEWHVRKTFQLLRPAEAPFRRVPPWKQALAKPLDERIQRQLRLERIGGGMFAVIGGLLTVVGAIAFVVRLF